MSRGGTGATGLNPGLDLRYDPRFRRDTPLALKLKDRIRRNGPITVAEYMTACLADPEHGYYVHRQAIGAAGDFITAPEISQIFGELIGLWAAVVWQQMGRPAQFRLIELGPGRGTLMRDALRALRIVPGIVEAAEVVLVEINEQLRDLQTKALAGSPWRISWSREIPDRAAMPSIVIANEFIDTVPIHQYAMQSDKAWALRHVGLDATDQLCFVMKPAEARRPSLDAKPGDIRGDGFQAYGSFCRQFADSQPFAGLFLDYGHFSDGIGDTLQAMRAHAYEHPLTSPGEADLTVHVNFEAFAAGAIDAWSRLGFKLTVDTPVTQAEFLGSLGIMERTSRLMAANPAKAGEIEMGVARLMSPTGMGTRFKAIGLRSPHLPPLPGFPVVDK